MKSNSFKNSFFASITVRTLMMALVIGLITSCTKKDDPGGDDDNGGGGSVSTLTSSNWQKTIKDQYGFDLTLPSGWTFKSGNKQDHSNGHELFFTVNGTFDTPYNDLIYYLFDLTAKVTPKDGNFDIEIVGTQFLKGKQYTEVPTILGFPYAVWYFNTPKLCVLFSVTKDNNVARIAIVNFGNPK